MNVQLGEQDKDIAKSRSDFIKRLFAVTLIRDHHFIWHPFLDDQWRSMLLILISLTIVVSSWEGYFAAISKDPLVDLRRFWIDIVIVFSYLLLELSSSAYDLWFSIHVIIFLEYLLWGWCRTRLPSYRERVAEDTPKHQLSIVITLVWLIYFAAILLLKYSAGFFDQAVGFVSIAFAALAGVLMYRIDGKRKWTWKTKLIASFTPIALLIGLSLFFRA
jgi:hypothetical protein